MHTCLLQQLQHGLLSHVCTCNKTVRFDSACRSSGLSPDVSRASTPGSKLSLMSTGMREVGPDGIYMRVGTQWVKVCSGPVMPLEYVAFAYCAHLCRIECPICPTINKLEDTINKLEEECMQARLCVTQKSVHNMPCPVKIQPQ